MYAVEFEADIRDGVVKIPEEYKRLKNAHARIVVLVEEPETDAEVRAFSEHSASTIDEWRAPSVRPPSKAIAWRACSAETTLSWSLISTFDPPATRSQTMADEQPQTITIDGTQYHLAALSDDRGQGADE
ncbi:MULTISPECIES: hypothetical protein [Halomonas]|uniref:Uncharacterized protein n=1 Tax=Halomonas ventosae TaxID=229007 RepID=A0A4R6GKF4_9GAMM|nr:hypothetical protein [Halomonas ventosae]TDN95397.1 hypothetical protein DFO68_1453 [Halomonas ventosae]